MAVAKQKYKPRGPKTKEAYRTRKSCGHVRTKLRLAQRPAHHKPRPRTIEDLQSLLADPTKVYRNYQKYLPGLDLGPDGTPRQKKRRSDRLEAIIHILQMILHYTCLLTGRVSRGQHSGHFIRPALVTLANGLTLCRASRAIKDLCIAGYLYQVNICKPKAKGGFFSLNAIRGVNKKLFLHLGVSHLQLELSRHWKDKQEQSNKLRAKNIFTQLVTGKVDSTPTPKRAVLADREAQGLRISVQADDCVKLRDEKCPGVSMAVIMRESTKAGLTILQYLLALRPTAPPS